MNLAHLSGEDFAFVIQHGEHDLPAVNAGMD
jgi:hypothetical protein